MADITQTIVLDWPDIGYDEKDDRIKKFYSQQIGATTDKNSIFYKKYATDVFIAAMALGKKAGHKKDFSDGKKASNIPKSVMGRNSTYVWMMIAVALEETDGDYLTGENDSSSVGESIILENPADSGDDAYLLNEDYVIGDLSTDTSTQNELFDSLDDDILDFTERNPFGDAGGT